MRTASFLIIAVLAPLLLRALAAAAEIMVLGRATVIDGTEAAPRKGLALGGKVFD